jgi:hypothetical protein
VLDRVGVIGHFLLTSVGTIGHDDWDDAAARDVGLRTIVDACQRSALMARNPDCGLEAGYRVMLDRSGPVGIRPSQFPLQLHDAPQRSLTVARPTGYSTARSRGFEPDPRGSRDGSAGTYPLVPLSRFRAESCRAAAQLM